VLTRLLADSFPVGQRQTLFGQASVRYVLLGLKPVSVNH
jgi:hypothetical protein